MRTTSVNDNVAVEAVENDRVPMGGIAWAGARGISKIEVQGDGDDWMEVHCARRPAARSPGVSGPTIGRLRNGRHTAWVRAVDGNGAPQVAESTGRRPDGSTRD